MVAPSRVDSDTREIGRSPRRGRVRLGTQIADQIRQYIKSHDLADGDPLPSEATLADEYDVSQRVVRDALRELSQQGVIRTQQGKRAVVSDLQPVAIHGYFRLVTDADSAAIEELIELRLALETKAAGLAAERITKQEIAAIESLLADTEGVTDRSKRVDLDLAFHAAIVRAGNNRFFRAVIDALVDVLAAERSRGVQLTESSGDNHADSDSEHRALLTALANRDAALSEQLMRAHLERVQRTFRGEKKARRSSR